LARRSSGAALANVSVLVIVRWALFVLTCALIRHYFDVAFQFLIYGVFRSPNNHRKRSRSSANH
jgi:hypothetical protein